MDISSNHLNEREAHNQIGEGQLDSNLQSRLTKELSNHFIFILLLGIVLIHNYFIHDSNNQALFIMDLSTPAIFVTYGSFYCYILKNGISSSSFLRIANIGAWIVTIYCIVYLVIYFRNVKQNQGIEWNQSASRWINIVIRIFALVSSGRIKCLIGRLIVITDAAN